jgi:hypothetical protein
MFHLTNCLSSPVILCDIQLWHETEIFVLFTKKFLGVSIQLSHLAFYSSNAKTSQPDVLCSWEEEQSQGVPADAGFLGNTATVLET